MRNRFVPTVEGLSKRIAPTDFGPLPAGDSTNTSPPPDPPQTQPSTYEAIQVGLIALKVGLGL